MTSLETAFYIMGIIYMSAYLLLLVAIIIAFLIMRNKFNNWKLEMEIRKQTFNNWLKVAPLISILRFPFRKFLQKFWR